MKTEDKKWLPLSFLPWESKFQTINCAFLPEYDRKKITLSNFPARKASVFKDFNDKRDMALLFSTTKDLYILFKSKIDKKEGLRKYCTEAPFYRDDTMEVMLDPTHGHRTYYLLGISALGKKSNSLMTVGQGRVRYERKVKGEPADIKWDAKIKISKTEWQTLVKIPYKSVKVEMDPSLIMGIKLMRHRASEGKTVMSHLPSGNSVHTPWAFSDLVFEKKSAQVEKIFLDDMFLDVDNKLAVTVKNLKKDALGLTLKVATFSGEEYKCYFGNSGRFELRPGETKEVSMVYRLDPAEGRWQKIRIELLEESGKEIYSGDFYTSYRNGMELAFGQPGCKCEDPKSDDPDFYRNKRRFIMARFPKFERINTLKGAPNDFCIRSEDKKVMFNLMKPGAMKKIAEYVHGRFDNDIDRILGAAFLIHQPAFMNYVNTSAFVEDNWTPLSILRFQNAQCGSFADVLLGLIEHLRIGNTKKCWTGHILGLNGHMIMAIHYKGKHVPLDGQAGVFYFKKGNKDLATIEDLNKDPWISDLARNGNSRFWQARSHLHFGHYGKVTWPEGAPAE